MTHRSPGLRKREEKEIMLKVLLVDDEPFILQGMEKLVNWKEEGFEIAAAMSDGAEALSYFEDNKVDPG